MQIYVQNQQDKMQIDPALETTLQIILQEAASRERVAADAEMGLTLVDDEEIARLNMEYRGVQGPTDVLSFAMREQGTGEPDWERPGLEELLGDVVISVEMAVRQAGEFGHSLEREVGFLALHGFLHLLGYDHLTPEGERLMEELSEKVLAGCGLARS